MFRSVLDVPDDGWEVGTTLSTTLTILSLGSYWSVVKMKDGGRDWDVVDCWFLIYGREEGVWCVCVHTRGCECHGKKAVTWWFV